MKNEKLPWSWVSVSAELATENGLSDISLDLENHGTTLRFTTELENEPGIRFRTDRQVNPSGGFFRLAPEFQPPVAEDNGLRVSPSEVHYDIEPAKQLARADPARAAHAARVDGHSEGDGLVRKATERCGVEVEAQRWRGGLRWSVVLRRTKRHKGCLWGEVLDLELAEARGWWRVDAGAGRSGGGEREFQSQRFDDQANKWAWIHACEWTLNFYFVCWGVFKKKKKEKSEQWSS